MNEQKIKYEIVHDLKGRCHYLVDAVNILVELDDEKEKECFVQAMQESLDKMKKSLQEWSK